jgi:hypothetical protein
MPQPDTTPTETVTRALAALVVEAFEADFPEGRRLDGETSELCRVVDIAQVIADGESPLAMMPELGISAADDKLRAALDGEVPGPKRKRPAWKGVPFADPQPGDTIIVAVVEGNPEAGESHDEKAEVLSNDGKRICYRLGDGDEWNLKASDRYGPPKVRVPASFESPRGEGQ